MKFRFVMGAWLAVMLIGALAVACSSDSNDDSNDNTPEATEVMDDTEPTNPPSEGGNGGGGIGAGGSATLTIGDETWEFDNYYCAFTPEESRNARVSFSSGAFGESATGARTQLDASIQDTNEQGRYEGEGTIHSLSLDDIDDFESPSVSWSAVSGLVGESTAFIQVEGNNVHAETFFDDGTTDALEEIPGTLDAICGPS